MASTAGYLARRAAQKERVRLLYRRALKDTLNWAVHRHLFYQDVSSPPPSASLSILIWISI
jgi:NADH dehydrogenase (ubiquinone) 1 beta subcomplex subunit 9